MDWFSDQLLCDKLNMENSLFMESFEFGIIASLYGFNCIETLFSTGICNLLCICPNQIDNGVIVKNIIITKNSRFILSFIIGIKLYNNKRKLENPKMNTR